ncbi:MULTISPECIES: hypothetical protein [Pseudomonas]|jgi:hypothetical protein|uniref:Uncharacterized protein n=1 Tax=Pseudomonas rustica TaxID=2827099 RepID=A0ABS5MZ30_9PSED|nr:MULTISPECIES: hypothetical protein [Pseudomonas]MBS4079279.1 hypothetical protein [Pseudomonas rustica]
MGKLVGNYYGAFGGANIYLYVTYSDDIGGAVTATASISGPTGTLTGHQTIGATTTTVMLTGTVGENAESWTFNTSDFNTLSGGRNYAGPNGVWTYQGFGLGRT